MAQTDTQPLQLLEPEAHVPTKHDSTKNGRKHLDRFLLDDKCRSDSCVHHLPLMMRCNMREGAGEGEGGGTGRQGGGGLTAYDQ